MTPSLRAVGTAAILAVVAAALPGVTAAHPLGNFTVNHHATLTVAPDRLVLELVIDAAEIPTIELAAGLDADGDGSADPDEVAAGAAPACRERADELVVAVGGTSATLELREAAAELLPGAGGLSTLRTTCRLAGGLAPIVGPTAVTITDRGDADRLGWREIVVRGDGIIVADQDAGQDQSARLTSYPRDLLTAPLDERSVTVTVRPGAGVTADPGTSPDSPLPATSTGEMPLAVDLRALDPLLAALGLLLAAASGAGHAVTPGHGKTLMAASLVGTRGRPRDALLLGLSVTASHTAGVLALALVVLVAGSSLPADRLYPILSAISGVLVAGIGAWLLLGCIRGRRRRASHDHPHPHRHPHDHEHHHDHDHDRDVRIGRGSVLAIGLAGGMIPSPAALVLLLGAVAAGQPAYGVALALAFGIGMAGVLVGLGLLVVHGRERIGAVVGRLPRLGVLIPAVPWVAALVVLAGGLALTGGAVAAI